MTEFKYQQGWTKNKTGAAEFDIMRLNSDERKEFGETLGMVWDLTSDIHYTDQIRLTPWDRRQVDFFEERLNKPRDFNYWPRGDGRYALQIYNKAFNYCIERPFAPADPKTQRDILSSLVTSCAFRTIYATKQKIVFITKNEQVASWARHFLNIRTKDIKYHTLDYPEEEKMCYSVWFYNPPSLKQYILDEFDDLRGGLDRLPDFDTLEGARAVLYEVANLDRMKSWKALKKRGLLDMTTYKAKEEEFYRIKKELRDVEDILTSLKNESALIESFDSAYRAGFLNKKKVLEDKKNMLEVLYDKIEHQLYGKKRDKKTKSNDWYERQLYKDLKAKQKAGEVV